MGRSFWLLVMLLGIIAGRANAGHAVPPPLKVCMLSGSEEYESDRTLEAFRAYLEATYPVRCTLLKAQGTTDLPGLEALDDCDVALFFTRRLTLPDEQLAKIKAYVESGRPIVGVRTASHGFQNWLEFDPKVLGGNYRGHYGVERSQRATPVRDAKDHPVLRGVGTIASRASLYKSGPVADDVRVLLTSTSPDATEPAAWVRERHGRVFYTTLGAQGDFENATFLRLLTNALFWAAGRDVPEPPAPVRPALRPTPEGTLRLTLRTRVEPFKGSGQWEEVSLTRDVPAAEVGVVVCDMWDLHWCRGATERCDAIATRMDPVLSALRDQGVQIVHAPSETMDFYSGTPQRLRAQLAPRAVPPEPPALAAEPKLPIDDSDGGCDTDDAFYLAWTRQNPRIQIGVFDAISDNGDEIYGLFRELGIKYVLVMGVHTNMCVLNRTFAIREMTRRGMQCVLVRDLTDTMYDPKDPPHVPHDQGTTLVVEHIEKYWAPSTTSGELVGTASER
jgi:type 1 glutamine amidotransferase/nicotinamidase-related amidase